MSDWTEDEICMLYRDAKYKEQQIEILTQLTGFPRWKIENILMEGGYLELDDKKKEEILKEYYNNGLSDSAIARKTGVAQSQVSTFLRSKGLAPNGKMYNKKEEKKVEEVKQEVKTVQTVQPEVKNTEVLEKLKGETKKNYEELKEVLPMSIPDPDSLPINYDIVETLTPQQYYEMAKMTIQSINSVIELMRTIWEG